MFQSDYLQVSVALLNFLLFLIERYICNKCMKEFASSQKLRNHRKSEHDPVAKIKSNNAGRPVLAELKRNADGYFVCKCGTRFKNKSNTGNHVKCYETESQSAVVAEESSERDDEDVDEERKKKIFYIT